MQADNYVFMTSTYHKKTPAELKKLLHDKSEELRKARVAQASERDTKHIRSIRTEVARILTALNA